MGAAPAAGGGEAGPGRRGGAAGAVPGPPPPGASGPRGGARAELGGAGAARARRVRRAGPEGELLARGLPQPPGGARGSRRQRPLPPAGPSWRDPAPKRPRPVPAGCDRRSTTQRGPCGSLPGRSALPCAGGGSEQREEEEWRRLLRGVTRLQACVRGRLLRKRFQSLRAQYEEVVRDIEGDLSRLEWRGRFLPRPVFLPQEPTGAKCSCPQEAVQSDETSADKTQGGLDASKPEQDGGSSNPNPPAQLQSENKVSSAGEGDEGSHPNLRADASECPGKEPSAPAGSQEQQNDSDVSSVWDSAILESLEAKLEIPPEDREDLPRTRAGLQALRSHLLMELLWLQQAIDSRKNYLMLKQRLGTPSPQDEHVGRL
ncbi:IQ domain-containing protein C [Porphyrio hochstetteri]